MEDEGDQVVGGRRRADRVVGLTSLPSQPPSYLIGILRQMEYKMITPTDGIQCDPTLPFYGTLTNQLDGNAPFEVRTRLSARIATASVDS